MLSQSNAKSDTKPAESDGSRKGKESNRKKSAKQAARDPEKIEAEISEIEKQLAMFTEQLAQPAAVRDGHRLRELEREYKEQDARLRALYEEWERVAAEAKNV